MISLSSSEAVDNNNKSAVEAKEDRDEDDEDGVVEPKDNEMEEDEEGRSM